MDESQLRQDEDYLEIGKGEGATLAWGGERLERDTEGYYLSPALLVDTTNDMRVNREEIFGPIATVVRVADAEEALGVANDTPYGLSAGVCTTSLRLNVCRSQARMPTLGHELRVSAPPGRSSSVPRPQVGIIKAELLPRA